jgi:murein endopeptidase
LRVEIARGRSYASILIIPQMKTRLCEALHGRRSWLELKLPWVPFESSPERRRRGMKEGERGRS